MIRLSDHFGYNVLVDELTECFGERLIERHVAADRVFDVAGRIQRQRFLRGRRNDRRDGGGVERLIVKIKSA